MRLRHFNVARNAITTVAWKQLNTDLLACDDVVRLQRWLTATIKTGHLGRALRIHGRLTAVRRAREIQAIKTMVAAVQKEYAA
jgi:hypothetical protein